MDILHRPVSLLLFFLLGISWQFAFPDKRFIYKKINRFILYISLPAIVLSKIPFIALNKTVLIPVGAAWLLFLGCIIFAYLMKRFLGYSNRTFACIVLCCGLGNTSFVGYPVLTYLYGAESLQYAIFVDQPGSFLIMSTLGIFMATYFSSGKLNWTKISKQLLTFPPFLVFIFSLFVPAKLLQAPILQVLNFIGGWMVPLALLSLGMQFQFKISHIPVKPFFTGIIYKLILGPLLIYILIFFVLKKHGMMAEVSVLECAMPPMITSSILAGNFGLDEELAAVFPTMGILISIITLSIWTLIL